MIFGINCEYLTSVQCSTVQKILMNVHNLAINLGILSCTCLLNTNSEVLNTNKNKT